MRSHYDGGMPYDALRHHRRTIRIGGFDYAGAGAYYVTICAHDRVCLFGEIEDGQMVLNAHGEIVSDAWHDLPHHYAHVALDAFIVMPNHIHGVITLTPDRTVGAGLSPAPTSAPTQGPRRNRHALSEIVRAFKAFSTRRINALRDTSGAPVWQRNYYEHIVRDDEDLQHIRRYIHNNPSRWSEDEYHP